MKRGRKSERGGTRRSCNRCGQRDWQVHGQAIVALGLNVALGADISEASSVAELFSRVEQRFGALHYLVNNAGVLGGPRFPDASASVWMRAVQVNLVGTLTCIHHAVPYYAKRWRRPRQYCFDVGPHAQSGGSSLCGYKGRYREPHTLAVA